MSPVGHGPLTVPEQKKTRSRQRVQNLFETPTTMTVTTQNDIIPMAVVFGMPGSGKTTISEAALKINEEAKEDMDCIGLDLDICVPQWMRDNFARGIYPTLQERIDFAISACDYVDSFLQAYKKSAASDGGNNKARKLVVVISFSFVNTDLRDTFRSRFPHALWLLVNTDEEEAKRRLAEREGHFYKGKPVPSEKSSSENASSDDSSNDNGDDNSEWQFAPVSFDHITLDGNAPVEENAQKLLRALQEEAGAKRIP